MEHTKVSVIHSMIYKDNIIQTRDIQNKNQCFLSCSLEVLKTNFFFFF